MRIVLIAAALLAPTAAFAQTANPTTVTPIQFNGSYTQNFNGLASTGSTGTALPQGFQINETGGNTSYVVGDGSGNAGGSYSFGSTGSTDRALGSLGSGTIAPIYYGAVLVNALTSPITSLTFSYVGEQWRLTNSTDDGLSFQYRVGGTDVSGADSLWTSFTGLDFAPPRTTTSTTATALDGNLAGNRTAITGTITGFSLLAGQNLAFRFVDANSNGSGDQGLAIDDLSITSPSAVAAVPETATWAMMIAGFGFVGAALRRRSVRSVLA